MSKLTNNEIKLYEVKKIEDLMKKESLQFKLDNGIILGVLDYELDNPIALWYHYHNTLNFEQFCESINKFISFTLNNKLSNNDINKLRSHYENFIKKMAGNKDTLSQELLDFVM